MNNISKGDVWVGNDDVVYFTEDMNQPVYEMNGMYVVKGDSK